MIGIGIGTHRRRFREDGAQAYFNAVIANGGALTDREQDAYIVYRNDSEQNANAWDSQTHLEYPMLGSTVESCVINAQNPGTFDAIAVNTVAGDFTANGFTPNGVNNYFNTQLAPTSVLTIQSVACEYYSRTNVGENTADLGCEKFPGGRIELEIRRVANNLIADCYLTITGRIDVANANSSGGYIMSRIAANDFRVFKNGVEIGAIATTEGIQPPLPVTFYLGAINSNSVAARFSTKENAGFGIYDGLITAQVLAQYTARQLMNINCVIGGREV